jgi:hypothetical protein
MAHKVFIIFLLLIGITLLIAVGLHGYEYYLTPIQLRAFSTDHTLLKPSGKLSHGLGIIGVAMITIGIITYSSRKRVRALWNLGKLSIWLEIHIFLCLIGPTLIVYHTTFKAGGIAAISLWTMLSVAASGIVGRFLYVLIPRNIKGSEMTTAQINEQFDLQKKILLETEIGRELVQYIDQSFAGIKQPKVLSETITAFIKLQRLKYRVKIIMRSQIARKHLQHSIAKNIIRTASARASLIQKSLLLLQIEKMFYYWHAIHLPFTAIMFVTLALHVWVALWLGYTWIF